MATIGLPLLARSIAEFRAENDDHTIEIAGLVFNHSSSYSNGPEGQQSIAEVRQAAKQHAWHIFNSHLRYSASYPRAAREGTSLAGTAYSRWEVIRGFERLKQEIFAKLGIERRTS